MPFAGCSVTKSVQAPFWLDDGLVGAGKNHARCTQTESHDAIYNCTCAYSIGRLITTPTDDGDTNR
jgi:hypothetical protein